MVQHLRVAIGKKKACISYLRTTAVSPWPVQTINIAFVGNDLYSLWILLSTRVRISFSSADTFDLRPFPFEELFSHVCNAIISASFLFKLSESSACFFKCVCNSENWVQIKCTFSFFNWNKRQEINRPFATVN
jgi:hypothetical protein